MTSALEAIEAAKQEGNQPPVENQTPETPPVEATPPADNDSTFLDEVEATERAASAGEIEALREQNRRLALRSVPEHLRPAAEQVLDLRDHAQKVAEREKAVEARERKETIAKVASEYAKYGVSAELLAKQPDEAAMREVAEAIKAAKGEEDETPAIMQEGPSTTAPKGQATQPTLRERNKRVGLEKGLTNLITGWQAGEE